MYGQTKVYELIANIYIYLSIYQVNNVKFNV